MEHGSTPTTIASRRPLLERVVAMLAALVVLGGVIARLTGLSRQSYWSDEMFSVTQASSSRTIMWTMGSTEIHPPLFSTTAWLWEHMGHSLHPGWMRLYPALCGVAALVACWHGLRNTTLSAIQRHTLLASTAACGLALVYSQDMRSYSLLFLAAVGLTAASVRVAGMMAGSRLPLLAWTLWGMLASATHLFGGLLAGASALLLCAFTGRRHVVRLLVALVLAETPQLLWLLHGQFTPGFDAGTTWITAPAPRDVWRLFTSTFGIGQLTMRPDGFPLAAPWALIALVLVGLLSLGLRLARHDPAVDAVSPTLGASAATAETAATQRRILYFLAALGAGLVMGVYVISQAVHLWTLRNMIVVAPAIAWGVALAVLLAAGPVRNQRIVAVALVLVSLAQLLGTWHAMRAPYKSQLSQAMERAAELRKQYPTMHVYQARTSSWWLYSSSLPATPGEYRRIMSPSTPVTLDAVGKALPAPKGTPALYLLYVSSSEPSERVDQFILTHNRAGCHAEPFVRVAFVVCAP